MTQSVISIRMESELKKSLEKVCAELVINVTTAFTMLAKKMVREQRVPFELCIDPFYSEANMKHLRERIKELDAGRGVGYGVLEE